MKKNGIEKRAARDNYLGAVFKFSRGLGAGLARRAGRKPCSRAQAKISS